MIVGIADHRMNGNVTVYVAVVDSAYELVGVIRKKSHYAANIIATCDTGIAQGHVLHGAPYIAE